jgi:hypothetical protein
MGPQPNIIDNLRWHQLQLTASTPTDGINSKGQQRCKNQKEEDQGLVAQQLGMSYF